MRRVSVWFAGGSGGRLPVCLFHVRTRDIVHTKSSKCAGGRRGPEPPNLYIFSILAPPPLPRLSFPQFLHAQISVRIIPYPPPLSLSFQLIEHRSSPSRLVRFRSNSRDSFNDVRLALTEGAGEAFVRQSL